MTYRSLFVVAAVILALSSPGQADETALSDLRIKDGGTIKPYTDIVTPPKPPWWSRGLPLPFSSISKASFQNTAQWLRDYDFDNDGWLTTAEMTQAWLIQAATWVSGREFSPSDLVTAKAESMRGVEISLKAERSLRVVIDGVAASAAQTAIVETLNALNNSTYEASAGGDGGKGTAGYRGNDNAKDE